MKKKNNDNLYTNRGYSNRLKKSKKRYIRKIYLLITKKH